MKILVPLYKTLEDASSSDELICCLLSLKNRVRRLELDVLVCDLHNKGKINFLSKENIEAIQALDANKFWQISDLLCKTIQKLNCSYQGILELVNTLDRKDEQNMMMYRLNECLVNWCKSNPSEAKRIVTETIDINSNCLPYCALAIKALNDVDLAFGLLDHTDVRVVSVGYTAIGLLVTENHSIWKRVIDECYLALTGNKCAEVRYSAIKTAFITWSQVRESNIYRQEEFLNTIVNEENGDDVIPLAKILFYYGKGLSSGNIDSILKVLTKVHPNSLEILRLLDQALASKDERWQLESVISVFESKIPHLADAPDRNDFHNFVRWVFENELNSSNLFSRWLVDGNPQLCSYLAEMLGGGENDEVININRNHLPQNENDQIFLIRKCVGFFWFNEVSAASILFSFVKNGKKAAKEESERLLFNPLLLSYGGKLRSFIEEQCNCASKRISKAAKRLLEKHDKYLSGLEVSNNLVELLPSNEQRRIASMKRREFNKNVNKKAHEYSIFSQVTTRQTLLYGNKSFYMMHGKSGDQTPVVQSLREFSYSTELPRLSIIDPVGFDLMLSFFRAEVRVSK